MQDISPIMVKHYCNKETEISEIHSMVTGMDTTVKALNKAIMGNGQAGMLQEFNQVKGAIKLAWGVFAIFGTSIVTISIFLFKLYSTTN